MENRIDLETSGYSYDVERDTKYLRKRLERACLKSDQTVIRGMLTEVAENVIGHMHEICEDVSLVSYLLHILVFNLPDGEELIEKIYKNDPKGYGSLYEITDAEKLKAWLCRLRDGICKQMKNKESSTQQKIVDMVKQYIDSCVEERITLHDTAEKFKISQSYLSSIFAQYSEMGFNDYVNYKKVEKAKRMLAKSGIKVQDIAEKLGFSNSFYFSRVFKKMENMSPCDYRMKCMMKKNAGVV